jgi:hypothetical protein
MGRVRSLPRVKTLMGLPAGASKTSGNVQTRCPHLDGKYNVSRGPTQNQIGITYCCNMRSVVLISYMLFGGLPTAMTSDSAPYGQV